MALSIVVLAAGQGKRMHSKLPKVLHDLAGKSLLEHVVNTTLKLESAVSPLIVYGHQGQTIRQRLNHLSVTWIEQAEQLGTGHAVLQALPKIPQENQVLILYGDVPLITLETLQSLITTTPKEAIGIITALFPNPTGLGRIIRDSTNKIQRVIEEKDASAKELLVNEINTGIYLIPSHYLRKWLPTVTNHNAQKEYYLTDIINIASQENITIHSQTPNHYQEVLGVNDRIQLSQLERFYQQTAALKLMQQGVTLYDPARFDLRGDLSVGQDVIIDVNVIIEGQVTIGNHCRIGPNTLLRNVTLQDHVEIKANSIIDGAFIAEQSVIGPFARIRPGTEIATQAQIGNFIEIKNSRIGSGTKIHHVGYIGDSEIGKQVNIGAGTITCNYDGTLKHKTVIGDHAFIGSNSELVAPVTIGEGATIGAGSTIMQDAPPNQLTVTRKEQRTIANWQKKTKKEKEI